MLRVFRSFGFAVVLVMSAFPAQARADGARRVAVVVNLGDPGSPLGAALGSREAAARQAYVDAGYEVIVLSVTPDAAGNRIQPTRGELERTLGSLSGVSELKLDLLGHGAISSEMPDTPELRERFPKVRMAGPVFGAMDPPGYAGREASFAAISTEETEHFEKSDPRLYRDAIGTGDLRRMLADARSRNPGLVTTLHALNCFSGSIGRDLSDMPGVQVFSSSPEGQVAIAYPPFSADGRPPSPGSSMHGAELLDYMGIYYEELRADLAAGRHRSEQEIHDAIVDRMLVDARRASGGMGLNRQSFPRSQSQQLVSAWCSRNPEDDANRGGVVAAGAACRAIAGTPDPSSGARDGAQALRSKLIERQLQLATRIADEYAGTSADMGCNDPRARAQMRREAGEMRGAVLRLRSSVVGERLRGGLAALTQDDVPMVRERLIASLKARIAEANEMGSELRTILQMQRDLASLESNPTIDLDEVREGIRTALAKSDVCLDGRACDQSAWGTGVESAANVLGIGFRQNDVRDLTMSCYGPQPSPGSPPPSPDAMLAKARQARDCVVARAANSPALAYRTLLSFQDSLGETQCRGLEAEIALHRYEARCAQRFGAEAGDDDWRRMLEIHELGAR